MKNLIFALACSSFAVSQVIASPIDDIANSLKERTRLADAVAKAGNEINAHGPNSCLTAPLPLDPVGPVVSTNLRWGSTGALVPTKVWRQPCSPTGSMIVFTLSPQAGNAPMFLCSSSFTLLQGAGLQTDDIQITLDPSSNSSFCGDVLTKLSFGMIPRSGFPSSMDMDGALRIVFDGSTGGMVNINLPAYNPDAYGPPVPHPTRNYAGQWHVPAEAGRGLSMFQFGNTLFALWFVYDRDGKATWYQLDTQWTANDRAAGIVAEWTGPGWAATYAGDRTLETVGNYTINFTSATKATMSYNVDGVSRTVVIEKIE